MLNMPADTVVSPVNPAASPDSLSSEGLGLVSLISEPEPENTPVRSWEARVMGSGTALLEYSKVPLLTMAPL